MEKWQHYIAGFEYSISKEYGRPPSFLYSGQLHWYKNGTLDSEVDIKWGQLNGYWTRYEKGKIWWRGHYKDGYLFEEWRLVNGTLVHDNSRHFRDSVFDQGHFKICTFTIF